MKRIIMALALMSTASIALVSCQKGDVSTNPTPSSGSAGQMNTMSATAATMPDDGAYKEWISKAVLTTNPARLTAFHNVFDAGEPLSPYLLYSHVVTKIDGLGQNSIGIIIEAGSNDTHGLGYIYCTRRRTI